DAGVAAAPGDTVERNHRPARRRSAGHAAVRSAARRARQLGVRRQPACAVTGDQLVPAGRRVAAYAAVAPLATGACPGDAAWHLGDHAGATADRPQPAPGCWADPVPTPGRAGVERQWLRAGVE